MGMLQVAPTLKKNICDMHIAYMRYAQAITEMTDEIARLRQAALDEREACAKVCYEIAGGGDAFDCMDAIRARGEK